MLIMLCVLYCILCLSGDEESGSGSGSGFTTEPMVVHTEPPMVEADISEPQPAADAAPGQTPQVQIVIGVTALVSLVLQWR